MAAVDGDAGVNGLRFHHLSTQPTAEPVAFGSPNLLLIVAENGVANAPPGGYPEASMAALAYEIHLDSFGIVGYIRRQLDNNVIGFTMPVHVMRFGIGQILSHAAMGPQGDHCR
jgi:hypothetical protein